MYIMAGYHFVLLLYSHNVDFYPHNADGIIKATIVCYFSSFPTI